MNEHITVKDKLFKSYIDEKQLQSRIQELAHEISLEYKNKKPIFLAVLNGSFMFAAEMFKHLKFDCEISFVKLASYSGLRSTGKVRTLVGLEMDLENRHVIIMEDIVDSGMTLSQFIPVIAKEDPASIKVASLLVKPEALKHEVQMDYVGFKIPDRFVVGFGLDYDGFGRNYGAIYQLASKE